MGLLHSCVLRNVLCSVIFYLYYIIVPVTPYTNHTLEEDKVCGLRDVTKILTVGKDEKSALIVRATTYFTQFSGNYPFKCSFIVEASFNQGLFAVIQKMKLRQNPDTNECIDYIQFCEFGSNAYEKTIGFGYSRCDRERLGPFCGDVSLATRSPKFVGPNNLTIFDELKTYENQHGGIAVKIFISNRKLLPNETLELEIAFTAYKPCSRDISSYKMCSGDYLFGNSGACIYKEFFHDGVVNCPINGCGDECVLLDTSVKMSTKVTLTAVTSIFLSFFLFLGCMWVCRYFEVLCWSMQNMRGGSCAQRSARTSVNVEDPYEPSAPSLPQNSPDKDLPPSYETLFPDR